MTNNGLHATIVVCGTLFDIIIFWWAFYLASNQSLWWLLLILLTVMTTYSVKYRSGKDEGAAKSPQG